MPTCSSHPLNYYPSSYQFFVNSTFPIDSTKSKIKIINKIPILPKLLKITSPALMQDMQVVTLRILGIYMENN